MPRRPRRSAYLSVHAPWIHFLPAARSLISCFIRPTPGRLDAVYRE